MEILENDFYFDAITADMFVRTWNCEMEKYGFVSLYDALSNPLLLGGSLKIQRELEKNNKRFIWHFYGWKMKLLSVVSAFEVEKGWRVYIYKLKLPELEELNEES